MAAITQRLLRIRPVRRRDIRRFSSSSDSEPPPHSPDDSQPESEPAPSFSSYLKEVRAHLKREPTLENRPKPFSFSNRSPPPPRQSTNDSIEQISRSLSEFRALTDAPHRSSGSDQHVSLQELYNRNVISSPDDSVTPSNSGGVKRPSFEIIRQSLQDFRTRSPAGTRGNFRSDASDPLSIERLKENLKPNPDRNLGQEKVTVIGGTDLPYFMRNDIKGSEENTDGRNEGMRTALVKAYGYKELGEELKKLRSDKRKGKGFSLSELNERLAMLKEITEKNSQNAMGGLMKGIREIISDSALKAEQNKKKLLHRLDILGAMGGTPKYMLKDPKENLVEKYYHPDNMSSAEKLKLELQKVRDEFKMSESDCGSARVQVAQLTTKIKHLSNVLSKKDKHSRKGLQDMVQRRKKLLKYLRKTDWDSYTLVLSKLGLRDNPVSKA